MAWTPLPVGIEDFAELRQGYYFIDKTLFIKDLLDMKGKVNLFTRPRRFGKTLNMSMLRYFFEISATQDLFQGLKIMDAGKTYLTHMGKYPVISLTLKSKSSSSSIFLPISLKRFNFRSINNHLFHYTIERL